MRVTHSVRLLLALLCANVFAMRPASALPPPDAERPEGGKKFNKCAGARPFAERTVGGGGAQVFEMVALGDSVVWGQGLSDNEKFTHKVQDFIAHSLSRPTRLRVYAHSGAPITVIPGTSGGGWSSYAEVPGSNPSITLQSECVSSPEQVDLIIADGCINDMDHMKIVDPSIDPNSEWINRQANQYCGEPMEKLLSGLLLRFPAAKIVVTGYFPLIGRQTPATSITAALAVFLRLANLDLSFSQREWVVRNSRIWFDASTYTLQRAVEKVNLPTKTAQQPRGRVAFAPVGFGDANAFGAPQSWLWSIPYSTLPVSSKIDNVDSVYYQRERACGKQYPGLELDNIFSKNKCIRASAFHPNRSGSMAYAEAVQKQAMNLLHQEPGPLDLNVSPRTGLPLCTGTQVTVKAKDPINQLPVAGDVEIGGVVVGKTNAPFLYTFHSGYGPQAKHKLIVRAPGYAATAMVNPFQFGGSLKLDLKIERSGKMVVIRATNPRDGAAVEGTVLLEKRRIGSTNSPLDIRAFRRGAKPSGQGNLSRRSPKSAKLVGYGYEGQDSDPEPENSDVDIVLTVVSECFEATSISLP